MNSNVVTVDKFGGAARLRELGIDVEERLTADQIAEMKLPEPKYGEVHLGELEDDEATLFYRFFTTNVEYEDAFRTTLGDAGVALFSKIKESDRARSLNDMLKEGEMKLEFVNEDEAERYFRLEQLRAYLHSTLYFSLGERLGHHKSRLGIRSPKKGTDRLRVVQIERRY